MGRHAVWIAGALLLALGGLGAGGTPVASPVAGEAPYGIGAVTVAAGTPPDEVESRFFQMPDEVAGLPQRETLSDASSATAIYLIDTDPAAPRFGIVVAVKVAPTDDADGLVAALERDRWGDPADHNVTASGKGEQGEPAFREFSRLFAQTQFLLPNRPIYFLLWYRAGQEYAFMVIADSPAVREEMARAVSAALGRS